MRAALPLSALLLSCLSAFAACSSEPTPVGSSGSSGGTSGAPGDAGEGGVPSDASTPDAVTPSDASGDADAGPVGKLFAFVGSSDGKIRSYGVDAKLGTWTFVKESAAGTNPSFLAFDPPRRRVVAVDSAGGGLVRSFAFDPATGGVSELGSKPAGGTGSTHLSFDPAGKWVMVANYNGGNMSIFPIDAAGALGDASDTKASGAMSHWAGTNPSGTHVFVPALGANVVAQYTLSAATGALTDNGTAALPPGAGPRHLAFHASEKWAYVINELAVTVTTFDFDKATGKLTAKQTISALPVGQSTAGVSGAEIFVHPSGKHVYASTRGFNSVVQLAIDPTNGTLTRVAHVDTGGNRPRSFGMDPEGTLLYAGNEAVDQVVGFRIDGTTGTLTPLGKTVDVKGPTFVGLARIP
ncbi:MAG: lactonase family protein [Deltaproteobacteria bacterium]|nr:lactonase family protein [Deltaproteobacteria bacterium]